MKRPLSYNCRRSGFTLIELILAMGIAAIVLAAVNAAFFSAMRLRERTTDMIEEAAPIDRAVDILRRDLLCVVPSTTNSVLAGDFRVGDVSTIGLSQSVSIEMFSATGVLRDTEPWGEIQRVTYGLRAPTVQSPRGGRDLVRTVTRNLLATVTPTPEEQWMMGEVDSFDLECYDGTRWRTTWDTTLGDTNMPTAVRIRINLSKNRGGDARSRQPIELVVPIDSTPRATQMASQTTGS
ncbi:MAG TPA: type II secretion system protein GspJ [Candidatus Limnocylindria bacterium]|nr:type II secretion system protein GspJ [Candidatus Limnocylindria bacterium]